MLSELINNTIDTWKLQDGNFFHKPKHPHLALQCVFASRRV